MTQPDDPEPFAALTPRQGAIAIAVGFIAGLVIVLVPYFVGRWLTGSPPLPPSLSATAGLSLTALFPIVQGFAMALAMGPRRFDAAAITVMSFALALIELVAAAVILREGVICLIIMSPLLLGLVLFGAFLGRLLARRQRRPTLVQASLLPLLLLGVFAEATAPAPNYEAAVSDSVVVDAPPEYVWRYVVQYPENTTPPEYWLWSIGLPHPTQSVADTHAVGATRLCKFSTGIAFEERITALEPNRLLAFDVTRQPDHPEVTGHFQFDHGEVRLTANADGTTTITATSWYRLFVRPAPYFDLWTAEFRPVDG